MLKWQPENIYHIWTCLLSRQTSLGNELQTWFSEQWELGKAIFGQVILLHSRSKLQHRIRRATILMHDVRIRTHYVSVRWMNSYCCSNSILSCQFIHTHSNLIRFYEFTCTSWNPSLSAAVPLIIVIYCFGWVALLCNKSYKTAFLGECRKDAIVCLWTFDSRWTRLR